MKQQMPARLGKKQQESCTILCNYSHIILPILIVVLIVLIVITVAVCIDIATAHNNTMVMVESGNYYNHLQDVI